MQMVNIKQQIRKSYNVIMSHVVKTPHIPHKSSIAFANGDYAFINYVPIKPILPLLVTVKLAIKMPFTEKYRCGKRYIKIKRKNKTRKFYTTKWNFSDYKFYEINRYYSNVGNL